MLLYDNQRIIRPLIQESPGVAPVSRNVSCQVGSLMEYLENVTPRIPSRNMKESIEFMVEVFGFESFNHSELYSELVSGNLILGIIQAHGEPN